MTDDDRRAMVIAAAVVWASLEDAMGEEAALDAAAVIAVRLWYRLQEVSGTSEPRKLEIVREDDDGPQAS